jgi:hypothetical protein
MSIAIHFDVVGLELTRVVETALRAGRGLQDIPWSWSSPKDGQAARREFADAIQHLVLAQEALKRATARKGQWLAPEPKGAIASTLPVSLPG